MKVVLDDHWATHSFDTADHVKIKLRGAFNSIAPFNFKTSGELALWAFQSTGHQTGPHGRKSPRFPAHLWLGLSTEVRKPYLSFCGPFVMGAEAGGGAGRKGSGGAGRGVAVAGAWTCPPRRVYPSFNGRMTLPPLIPPSYAKPRCVLFALSLMRGPVSLQLETQCGSYPARAQDTCGPLCTSLAHQNHKRLHREAQVRVIPRFSREPLAKQSIN